MTVEIEVGAHFVLIKNWFSASIYLNWYSLYVVHLQAPVISNENVNDWAKASERTNESVSATARTPAHMYTQPATSKLDTIGPRILIACYQ